MFSFSDNSLKAGQNNLSLKPLQKLEAKEQTSYFTKNFLYGYFRCLCKQFQTWNIDYTRRGILLPQANCKFNGNIKHFVAGKSVGHEQSNKRSGH